MEKKEGRHREVARERMQKGGEVEGIKSFGEVNKTKNSDLVGFEGFYTSISDVK